MSELPMMLKEKYESFYIQLTFFSPEDLLMSNSSLLIQLRRPWLRLDKNSMADPLELITPDPENKMEVTVTNNLEFC